MVPLTSRLLSRSRQLGRRGYAGLVSAFLLIPWLLILTSMDEASHEHGRLKDQTLPVVSQVYALQHTSMLVMSSINELGLLSMLEGIDETEFRKQEIHEMEHVEEGLRRFNKQLGLYRDLVLRYFPGEVGFAESLYHEGERLRALSKNFLTAIQGHEDHQEIFQLKQAVEVSKDRFISMADEIIAHEQAEIVERHEVIDSMHSRSIGASLLLLLASFLLVFLSVLTSGTSNTKQH